MKIKRPYRGIAAEELYSMADRLIYDSKKQLLDVAIGEVSHGLEIVVESNNSILLI